MNTNEKPEEFYVHYKTEPDGKNLYIFLRCQQRNVKQSIKRMEDQYPSQLEEIFHASDVPNAVDILNQLKRYLPEGTVSEDNNKIRTSATKEDIINKIKEIIENGDKKGIDKQDVSKCKDENKDELLQVLGDISVKLNSLEQLLKEFNDNMRILNANIEKLKPKDEFMIKTENL